MSPWLASFRDWLRGYTDADMASYIEKRNLMVMSTALPEFTPAELCAGVEFDKARERWKRS